MHAAGSVYVHTCMGPIEPAPCACSYLRQMCSIEMNKNMMRTGTYMLTHLPAMDISTNGYLKSKQKRDSEKPSKTWEAISKAADVVMHWPLADDIDCICSFSEGSLGEQ